MKFRECVKDMRVNAESVSQGKRQNRKCCAQVALIRLRLNPVWTNLMCGGKMQKVNVMGVNGNQNISVI